MSLSTIIAMDENKLIGNKNSLPWHLPADLLHFKEITRGHTIIMGRKTFDSIKKPLPDRTNIVLTSDINFKPEGVLVFNDIEELKEFIKEQKDEVFVIGGSHLIKALYPMIEKFYITHIMESFVGDCYVRFIDFKALKLINKETHFPEHKNNYFYSFCEYIKNNDYKSNHMNLYNL